VLFDGVTARPVCVMEAAHLSALRTAAVTALAAQLLARPPVGRLALIGAGAIGAMHLDLLPRVLSGLSEVRLYDVERPRADALRALAGRDLERRGVRVRIAVDAETAIRGAELVVPATTTTCGYIALRWLAPGALLVNVSLDDALPEVVLGADRVVVDDWRLVRSDDRRLLGRMARAGLVSAPGEDGAAGPVHAELGEIVIGRTAGRTHADQRILVNPFGLAIEDVALARSAYAAARALGLGVSLER
jgi:ornithine cyclodeaminase